MTTPSQNLRATEVIAGDRFRAWPQFRAELARRRQPPLMRSSGGDGRGSDISDPTGSAVTFMSYWEEYEFDAVHLTEKILESMRQLEEMMNKVLYDKPTADEKAKMRCSGEHDATCTELAAVPSKRGMCANGYMQWYRAQQKQPAHG